MSRFAKQTNSTSSPQAKAVPVRKKSIFGGITKPKGSRPRNYFTPGHYRLKATQILVGVSENPDHKNEHFGRAAFEVHPPYQGLGLGKQLMQYVIERLQRMQVERISLFADPGVIEFYGAQGWEL